MPNSTIMSTELPSRFQPTQVVILRLGMACFEAYVESVRFSDEGAIYYTLQVYYDGGDELHVLWADVPSAFVEERKMESLLPAFGEIVKPGK